MVTTHLVLFSFFDGASASAAVSQTTVQGAGRARKGRRQYRKLVVRINGEYIDVDSVEQLLALLKETKKDIKVVADEKAVEIIKVGKRVGDARRDEARSIELIEAPGFAKQIIEDRIRELEIYYWKLIEAQVNRMIDEEDERILLLDG